MALPQGINFSSTGYASGNNFAEIGTAANYDGAHSSTQGQVCGWEDAIDVCADRDTGLDERLRGAAVSFATQDRFRIDLPATGDHVVRCACGDSSLGGAAYLEVFDTTTSKLLVDATGLASTDFLDATDVVRTSAADWVSNNAPSATLNFATTICRFRNGSGSDVRKVAHIYIEAVAAGGIAIPVITRQFRQRWAA